MVIICPQEPLIRGSAAQICISGNYDKCVGANVTFKWFKNSVLIAATTGPCFNIPVVSCSDAGVYTVQLTGSTGTFTTLPCKIKVAPCPHSGDPNGDGVIVLTEMLRVIQFYNSDGFHCDPESEDGYAPGPGSTDCLPHASDYAPQDWRLNLTEMLRTIQLYNSGGYRPCPDDGTEDGYCPGPA